MARPSTRRALERWLQIGIKKVLASIQGVVVPANDVLNDGEIGKLTAPSAPLAYLPNIPTTVDNVELASTTAKRVRAVWGGIYLEVEEVVAEHLQERV